MGKLIMGMTWSKIQMMQSAQMITTHSKGCHRATINKNDVAGEHETEISLSIALEDLGVSPRVMLLKDTTGPKDGSGTITHTWVLR